MTETAKKKRRKYAFKTREAAEEAVRSAEHSRHANYCAVDSLVKGLVQWLPSIGPYKAGLVRPDGAHGGIVIVCWEADDDSSPHVNVHYVDDFVQEWGARTIFNTSDAERMALYRIALAVVEARNKACAYPPFLADKLAVAESA